MGSQAVLFSAATSASIINIRQDIKEDFDETTTKFLRVLIQNVNANDAVLSEHVNPPSLNWNFPIAAAPTFDLTMYASLTVLGKQWLHQYDKLQDTWGADTTESTSSQEDAWDGNAALRYQDGNSPRYASDPIPTVLLCVFGIPRNVNQQLRRRSLLLRHLDSLFMVKLFLPLQHHMSVHTEPPFSSFGSPFTRMSARMGDIKDALAPSSRSRVECGIQVSSLRVGRRTGTFGSNEKLSPPRS